MSTKERYTLDEINAYLSNYGLRLNPPFCPESLEIFNNDRWEDTGISLNNEKAVLLADVGLTKGELSSWLHNEQKRKFNRWPIGSNDKFLDKMLNEDNFDDVLNASITTYRKIQKRVNVLKEAKDVAKGGSGKQAVRDSEVR